MLEKRRRIYPILTRIVLLFLVLASLWAGVCCVMTPASMKQVKAPRGGRVYNNHVAIVYSKHYQMSMGGLEKLHSFDIRKYARIYLKLNTEGLLRPEDVFVPKPVTQDEILLVHTPEFVESLKDSPTVARYIEAPFAAAVPNVLVDAAILNAFRYSTGGTILASRLALKHGIAINIGGGYHHAKPYQGEGFCIYADMPIAIRVLQKENLIKRAMVIDLDVHQGNGTAVCFSTDNSVFTFSMHQQHNYPPFKPPSDLDLGLENGTEDDEYLSLLDQHLPGIIESHQPQLVFYLAGADPYREDQLGGLHLTVGGLRERDEKVINYLRDADVPTATTTAGGYALSKHDTVEIHCNTIRVARDRMLRDQLSD